MSNTQIPEDARAKALMTAQSMKDSQKVQNFAGKEASTADVERGPTTLPGQTPGYGQNYNLATAPEAAPSATVSPTKEPETPGQDIG